MRIGVVTGASSGIGREFVYAVDKEGLDEIWVIARRQERLEELKERQGPHTWGSSLIDEEDIWDKRGDSGTIRGK